MTQPADRCTTEVRVTEHTPKPRAHPAIVALVLLAGLVEAAVIIRLLLDRGGNAYLWGILLAVLVVSNTGHLTPAAPPSLDAQVLDLLDDKHLTAEQAARLIEALHR